MRGTAYLCVFSLTACSSAGGGDPGEPPTLEVLTPERGATSDGAVVTVTGRVTDDDLAGVRVTVNGVDAATAADGSFSAQLDVSGGINLIETHAIDAQANDVRDVRAVLAGTLLPTDGTAGAPIAARIGAGGWMKVGTALAAMAQALDWQALGLAMNPVYDSSGCNSARLDIEQLSVGTIGVSLVPKPGAIGAVVTIDDVYVRMHADFEALCIDGSTTVEVRASRALVTGDLAITAASGRLVPTLPASAVTLEGFALNVGGVPGAIEDLIEDEARNAAEDALHDAVRSEVPAQAEAALGDLVAQSLASDILDRSTVFTITPQAVAIDASGLVAAVDTRVAVAGGEGGVYAASPDVLGPGVWGGDDLGIALADDLLNQLFGGLWASGAVSQVVPLDGGTGAILGTLFDDDARSVAVELMLPPQVRAAGGALELAIGDAILSVRDAGDVEIQRFALSIVTSLAATPSATGVVVTVGTPVVKAQVLAESAAVDQPTEATQLEDLVTGVWPLLGGLVDDALADLPLPEVDGIGFGSPLVAGRDGFLVVDLPIQ
jgi:hypothetical protein